MSTSPLMEAAQAVMKNAHAPYSNFQVGAAVRTDVGDVFVGCNVENVAYPEGTCAEAGALAAMVAAGQGCIVEVAVIAASLTPVPPCGGCRQKLREFGGGDVVVNMGTTSGKTLSLTLEELLPGVFNADHMNT